MPRVSTAPVTPKKIAALTLAAATAAFGLTLVQATPAASAEEAQSCTPGEFPGVDNDGLFATDGNINVYVGGNYSAAPGAAESEGTLVIAGDASFTSGLFNIGTVGVGSGILPEPGSDMLVVGGSIFVDSESELQVGFPVDGFEGGGNVVAGGSITVEPRSSEPADMTEETRLASRIQTNGGETSSGVPDALGSYSNFGDLIAAESAALASQVGVAGDVQGSRVTFTGDGSEELQVFTVSASDLSSVSEVSYVNVGASAPIVINVVGDSVNFDVNYIDIDSQRVDLLGDAALGNAASRILWNFEDATDVTLGGTSQLVGSVLVPSPNSTTDITAHTNGRVFVGGDLMTHGSGNEQHAYPWTGSPLTDCTPRDENSETPEEEETETPDEGDEVETPDEGDEPEVPVEEEDETPVIEDETPQVEEEVVVEETEAPVTDDATNAADEESLPVTGANIGLVLPLAALLLVLIGGGLALIARTRSRA